MIKQTTAAATMISTRRLVSFAGIAYLGLSSFTKPALAQQDMSSQSMRSRIERLNVRDDELATNKKILDVVSWEAVKNDAELQDACKNNQLSRRFLDELYYMSAFYEKPLSANRRMRMRNLLLDLYDSSSTTEDEKRYIVSIMNYFELLDETNLNQ